MQKYVKNTQPAHVEPQMKNTLTARLALPAPELTRYGVANAMAQFHNLHEVQERVNVTFVPREHGETYQLDATESDMAFARTLRGKISPVMTHAMGPHVDAKAAM